MVCCLLAQLLLLGVANNLTEVTEDRLLLRQLPIISDNMSGLLNRIFKAADGASGRLQRSMLKVTAWPVLRAWCFDLWLVLIGAIHLAPLASEGITEHLYS